MRLPSGCWSTNFGNETRRSTAVEQRKLLLKDIAGIIKVLHPAFKDIDPSGEKERQRIEENTLYYRQQLETVESDLEKANEELLRFEEAGPSGAHFYAFALLLAGFVLQLIAEILRPC